MPRNGSHVEGSAKSVPDFETQFGALHGRPEHGLVVPIGPVQEAAGQGNAERMGCVRNHLGALFTLKVAHVDAILECVGPVELTGSGYTEE